MPFRIRTKLTVAFVGIILFIISVVGVIAYYNQKALFNSLHRVEYAYTEREYFSDIRIAVEKTLMAANDHLITGDRKEMEEFHRSAAEAERLFNEIPYEKVCIRCHPAAKGIVDRFYAIKGKELVEEMKYIKELSESFARIRSKGEEIFAIDRPVGSAAGARLMEEMDVIYHTETAGIIASYRGTIRGRVSEAITAAHAVRGRSWLIMMLAAVILASIGLVFSRLYARSFVLPIETMHERVDTIARGDFKARVEISSRDELGQLAGAMNEMAEQLDSFYGTLERQVQERTADLQYEKDKLIRVFEAMEDGVYIANQNYDIEYINPVLEKEFGPWKGIKCYTYLHDRTEVCPWCPNQRVFAGETVRWEWTSLKNGKTYDLIDTPMRQPDGSVWKLEIFRDITDKKEAEEKIKEQLDFLQRFEKVAVGRESRIKELRDENDRLKARIEELEKKLKG